nr:GNAT family N-acetyltransferase [Coralloluteibacterium stylophorae]
MRLRPLEPGDAAALFALFSEPRILRAASHPRWGAPADARDYVDALCAGTLRGSVAPWAVDLDAARCIGMVTLWFLGEGRTRAELSYLLASAYWGRGLGVEAVAAVLEWAGAAGIARVEASVDVDNAPSLRLLARLGFAADGAPWRRVRSDGLVRRAQRLVRPAAAAVAPEALS